MAQGAVWSPIDVDVNVKERKVAILFHLHGKLNIHVKAIQKSADLTLVPF
jgi:hypothetical protein